MKEEVLRIQTEIVYGLLTGALKLPAPVLATLFRTTRRTACRLSDNPGEDTVLLLGELETFFSEDTELAHALRRMVLDARPSQIRSLIRGYLRNYVYEW